MSATIEDAPCIYRRLSPDTLVRYDPNAELVFEDMTPEDLAGQSEIAARMVAALGALPDDARILEPSAGLGRLLDAVCSPIGSSVTLVAVEVAPQCAGELFRQVKPAIRCLADQQRLAQVDGRRLAVGAVKQQAHSKFSTRISTGAVRTAGSLAIFASALAMAAFGASWIIKITGTVSP